MFSFVLSSILCITTPEYATLQTNFTLTTIIVDNTTRIDVVRGRLYIIDNQSQLFEVTTPLHQLMWVKKDTVDIYYPDENKFFRILSHDTLPSQTTQISQVFNISLEHQLYRAGFDIIRTETSHDTLFFHWEKNGMPKVTTGVINDDLVVYRSSGLGWAIEFKFWDYRNVGGNRYPHMLRSMIKSGRVVKTEQIQFIEMQRNQPIPQHLSELTIPDDVEIKITEW